MNRFEVIHDRNDYKGKTARVVRAAREVSYGSNTAAAVGVEGTVFWQQTTRSKRPTWWRGRFNSVCRMKLGIRDAGGKVHWADLRQVQLKVTDDQWADPYRERNPEAA